MDPNITAYGDISYETAGFAQAKLLDRGQMLMTTERFGTFDPQPKHKGKVRTWRRYNSFPRATAPLAEGIPPKGHKITANLSIQLGPPH